VVKILTRAITPKKAPFDFAFFEDEIKTEMRLHVKPEVVSLLEQTVEGWKHKPDFGTRLTVKRDEIALFAFATGPDADQYNLVDAGSPPHTIEPRGGGTLRFRTGYQAATRPRRLTSRAPKRSGPMRVAKIVFHPGFEPRDFYETVGTVVIPEYRRRIKNALQRATRRMAQASN
jgi:hypothetical protein